MSKYYDLKRMAEMCDIPEKQAGEVLALIAENEQLSKAYSEVWEKAQALQSECDEFVKDAERYRWLRTHEPLTNEFYQGAQCRELRWGKRLDDLIDAAMSKEPKA